MPQPRIGFIGLGIMGSRMAANLAGAGCDLTVWTRTPGKAERWAAGHGAQVAADAAELGARSDVVITMVVEGAQVRDLLLGPRGVAQGAGPGTLCIDMSTIAPADAMAIAGDLAAQGLELLDAPVTGSSPKAQDGTLTIMAGGTRSAFERALPVLRVMGEVIVHVGPSGDGQRVKLLNNALAAANATALAEALVVAQSEGLDSDALLEVLSSGSGASTMLALKARPMLERDFTTLFKTDHMAKDVRLCLQEAANGGLAFPAAAHALELLAQAASEGFGDDDFASIVEPAARRAH